MIHANKHGFAAGTGLQTSGIRKTGRSVLTLPCGHGTEGLMCNHLLSGKGLPEMEEFAILASLKM